MLSTGPGQSVLGKKKVPLCSHSAQHAENSAAGTDATPVLYC